MGPDLRGFTAVADGEHHRLVRVLQDGSEVEPSATDRAFWCAVSTAREIGALNKVILEQPPHSDKRIDDILTRVGELDLQLQQLADCLTRDSVAEKIAEVKILLPIGIDCRANSVVEAILWQGVQILDRVGQLLRSGVLDPASLPSGEDLATGCQRCIDLLLPPEVSFGGNAPGFCRSPEALAAAMEDCVRDCLKIDPAILERDCGRECVAFERMEHSKAIVTALEPKRRFASEQPVNGSWRDSDSLRVGDICFEITDGVRCITRPPADPLSASDEGIDRATETMQALAFLLESSSWIISGASSLAEDGRGDGRWNGLAEWVERLEKLLTMAAPVEAALDASCSEELPPVVVLFPGCQEATFTHCLPAKLVDNVSQSNMTGKLLMRVGETAHSAMSFARSLGGAPDEFVQPSRFVYSSAHQAIYYAGRHAYGEFGVTPDTIEEVLCDPWHRRRMSVAARVWFRGIAECRARLAKENAITKNWLSQRGAGGCRIVVTDTTGAEDASRRANAAAVPISSEMRHLLITGLLCSHHRPEKSPLGNSNPLKGKAIATDTGVSVGAVSEWFKEHFGNHGEYCTKCRRNPSGLAADLRRLSGDGAAQFLADASVDLLADTSDGLDHVDWRDDDLGQRSYASYGCD